MKTRFFPALLVVVGYLAAIPALADPVPKPSGQVESFADLPTSTDPTEYVSSSGQFSVTFPSGCGRLYSKTSTAEDGSELDRRLAFVDCERYGKESDGCSVVAHVGAARDLSRSAARDMVLGEVKRLLDGYGVSPARQTPLHRDFGEHGSVEGLDVQANKKDGAGDVWIRGLLRGEDIFVLVAWKADGGMFEDPEYAVFFQSFRPWADEPKAGQAHR